MVPEIPDDSLPLGNLSTDEQDAERTLSMSHQSMISSLWRMHTSIPTETSRRIENMTWRMMALNARPPPLYPEQLPSNNIQLHTRDDKEVMTCIECRTTQTMLFYEARKPETGNHSVNGKTTPERIILCSACVSVVLSEAIPTLDNSGDPFQSFFLFEDEDNRQDAIDETKQNSL